MPPATGQIGLFLASFALTVMASVVLSRRIEQLGLWLRLSQSLLGVVAALGADAPEISSAISAIHSGQADLGIGIVIGSNIFNLAALLGLSAVITGRVRISRRTLYLNGTVACVVLVIMVLQLTGVLAALAGLLLSLTVVALYIGVLAVSPQVLDNILAHLGIHPCAEQAKEASDRDAARPQKARHPSRVDLLDIVPTLVAIVFGSIGMVKSASSLGHDWNISNTIVGTLVLASLTGIPNVVTALAMARKGRGSAVLSEGLNSNTINLIVGASLPAVLLGSSTLTWVGLASLWTLAAMTLLTLVFSFHRHGVGRTGGVLLIVVYAAFITLVIVR